MLSVKMPVVNLAAIPELVQRNYIQELPGYVYSTPIDLVREQDSCEDLRNASTDLSRTWSCYCSALAKNVSENHHRGRPVSWSDLPSPAVEKIYSFLSREDQYRMSLVCRRWSKEYLSPALWRTVKFHLDESKSLRRLYPQVAFAWRYGHLFRHVQVIYSESGDSESLKYMTEQLILFLLALTCQSRLLSISFINKSYYSVFRFFDTSKGVFHAIVEFLRSQTRLRFIEFHDSYVTKRELTHILRTAFLSNSESLRELKFKVFSCYTALDKSCRDDQELGLSFIRSFLNLEVFEADYTRFFELLISEPLKHARETDSEFWRNAKLKRIKLLCDRNVSNQFYFECLGIPTSAWTHLKKTCPEVGVDLRIATTLFYKDIIPFVIVPGIPLRSLELEQYSEENIDFLLKNLLKSGANDYLEEISISWCRKLQISACDMEEFLRVCPKLRLMKLRACEPDSGLLVALDCLLQNAPKALDAISIIVTRIHDVESASFYQDISNYYTSLFRMINVQLSVTVENGFHTMII